MIQGKSQKAGLEYGLFSDDWLERREFSNCMYCANLS